MSKINLGKVRFTYDDFTEEQLAALKGAKGDKGDAFTYEDFTPEQLASLKGDTGEQGLTGADGATFTPSVDAEGNLSWTNDKGLVNPPTVNIKGEKGDSGVNNIDDNNTRAITTYSSNKIETIKEDLSSQIKEIANDLAVTLAIGKDGLLYLADSKGNLLGNGINISNAVEVGSVFYSGRWYKKDDGTMFTNTTGSEIYAIVKNATKLTLTKADTYSCKVAVSINDSNYVEYTFTNSLNINIPTTETSVVKVVVCDITTTTNQYTNPQTLFMSNVTTDGAFLSTKDIESRKMIAFFGDSITRGNALVNGNTVDASKSYPHLVNKYLNTRPLQVGFGLTGVTIQQTANEGQMPNGITILQNVADGCPATYESDKVKYVFVNYGTNDNSSDFESAYDEYIKKIKELFPNSTIVCMQLITTAKKTAIQTVATNNNCKYYEYNGTTLSGALHPIVEDSELIANNIIYYIENTLNDTENQVKLTALSANTTSLEINEGESEQIIVSYTPANTTQRELVFSSDNSKIATVDGKGYVNAVASGNCNIICKSRYNDNINITIPITVIAQQTADTTGVAHNMAYDTMSNMDRSGLNNNYMYAGSDPTTGSVKSIQINCKSAGTQGYVYVFKLSTSFDSLSTGSTTLTLLDKIQFASVEGINTIPINYENTEGEEVYVGVENGMAIYINGNNANEYKSWEYMLRTTSMQSANIGHTEEIWPTNNANSQFAIAFTYWSDK